MTTVVSVIADNFQNLERLTLPECMFDSVAREWCTETNQSFDDVRNSVTKQPFSEVEPFCERFARALTESIQPLLRFYFYTWKNIDLDSNLVRTVIEREEASLTIFFGDFNDELGETEVTSVT